MMTRITAMGSNYKQLFQALPEESVPSYLCERILGAVQKEHARQQRVRLVISSLAGTGSLVGLVFAIPALIRAASVTGFSSFASLLVSDGDFITSHFGSFIYPLLEALPGFEVTVTLFLLAVFLVSLRNFVRGISTTRLFGSVHATSM
ncbi:MAG: hypothetical protein P4M11_00420 [Candidatus Pacebacteria bacterium]|nr:hypothetical protein [Candidatus Paceibacterota bacterium]